MAEETGAADHVLQETISTDKQKVVFGFGGRGLISSIVQLIPNFKMWLHFSYVGYIKTSAPTSNKPIDDVTSL